MSWARFDDNFPDHPKVEGLSDAAFRLHVSGICYSARYLTDGYIPAGKVSRLVPAFSDAALDELLDRKLWVYRGREQIYSIHDYLQWNRSRDKITAERERKRAGGRRGAKSRWTDG